jgi:hypothetical protein
VVDPAVRRTWQIDSGKVRIGGRHWEKTLSELVSEAALGLGVNEPVAADFYKLLVYDAGGFFVDHRDTEKVAGMFATMVLVLPSTHSGGELVVKHLGREVVLDLRREEPSQIGFAAFYADCVHEVRSVTAGCRLTLIYNLRFLGKRRAPKAPDYRAEQGRVVELLLASPSDFAGDAVQIGAALIDVLPGDPTRPTAVDPGFALAGEAGLRLRSPDGHKSERCGACGACDRASASLAKDIQAGRYAGPRRSGVCQAG